MLVPKYVTLLVFPAAALLLAGSTSAAQGYSDEALRVQNSVDTLEALAGRPDASVPSSILERAEAVVVVPSLASGGSPVGRQQGQGIVSLRDPYSRRWSAPAFVSISGGALRAPGGTRTADLILLVMNRDAISDLLKDESTLGGTRGSLAPGPVVRGGRAGLDVPIPAQILAYSRSRDTLEGVTVDGAIVRSDPDANQRFYGRRRSTEEVLLDRKLEYQESIPTLANLWRDTSATLAD